MLFTLPALQITSCRFRRTLAQALLTITLALFSSLPAAASQLSKAAVDRTLERLQNIQGISPDDIQRYSAQITALDYTGSRAVRALLQLPTLSASQLPTVFTLPEPDHIRYSAIGLLEYYVALPEASLDGARELLQELRNTSFLTDQVLASLPNMHGASGESCIRIIRRVKQLDRGDEASQWAVKELFTVPQISAEELFQALELLEPLTVSQKRAAEKYFTLAQIRPSTIPALLTRLATLTDIDAVNFGGLLSGSNITEKDAQYWLDHYFSADGAARTAIFDSLSPAEKTILLQGLGTAAPTIAGRLNSLHDVTDNLDREIGASRLSRLSPKELQRLFDRLDPTTRSRFATAMHQALMGHDTANAGEILRRATAASRRQLANDLTCENLYVLLSHGSELFDSSFRDILVPILDERIRSRYRNNLLDFLLATDPESLLVSDFISHLAWKDCLTIFFPTGVETQNAILQLLARSAFTNEEHLLFFAATFTELLRTLQPAARTTLLTMLMERAQIQDENFTRQIRVILQEYLEHHPDLLSADNREAISAMLHRLGRIDLLPYTATPFDQWLADGQLSSLSVFMYDDDGSVSYQANSGYLLRHGYRPTLADEYTPGPIDEHNQKKLLAELRKLGRYETENLAVLFRLAARTPAVIAWRKRVGEIRITHFVYVYQGKTVQKQLLKTFLTSGHELFAQRGHSYWRGEQLFWPLDQLLQDKEIPVRLLSDRPRFFSIGSCGGVRIYAELTRRFGGQADILATVGTGKSMINTPYNTRMLEIIAEHRNQQTPLSWQDLSRMTAGIFAAAEGEEYIRPGSLPAILYKMSVF